MGEQITERNGGIITDTADNQKTAGGLHLRIRGQGSPLLMIHGIISDSSFFEESAQLLSDQWKVITYDRRGYGQSVEQTYHEYSVTVQAEDAAEILTEIGGGPAWVAGNSAGGLIAIELALRHPELVCGMVLVEPSLGYDPEEWEKLQQWNQELNRYRQEGRIRKALPAFARVTGGEENGRATSMRELRRTYQNLACFMEGELNEIQSYLPPIEALRSLNIPVIMAVSEDGADRLFATSSRTAAESLGWPVQVLPGYHNTVRDHPREFAEKFKKITCNYSMTML